MGETIACLVLEAGRAERNYWSDLWHYRELFAILAWRDVRGALQADGDRRRLGADPAVPDHGRVHHRVRPAREAAERRRRALSRSWCSPACCRGSCFQHPVRSVGSLVGNANLISKVYFPRLVIPTARLVVALVDFLVNLAMLVVLMVWYGFVPGWRILLLPAFVLLAVLASLGPALWITALNVKYRDFRYIIPFVVQFGLYISPVGFSSSVVPRTGVSGIASTRWSG